MNFDIGELVKCGDETAIILRFWVDEGEEEGVCEVWAECLWSNGEIEDIDTFSLEKIDVAA